MIITLKWVILIILTNANRETLVSVLSMRVILRSWWMYSKEILWMKKTKKIPVLGQSVNLLWALQNKSPQWNIPSTSSHISWSLLNRGNKLKVDTQNQINAHCATSDRLCQNHSVVCYENTFVNIESEIDEIPGISPLRRANGSHQLWSRWRIRVSWMRFPSASGSEGYSAQYTLKDK